MQEENNGMEKAFLKERTSFGFICSCFGLLAERGNSSLLWSETNVSLLG